MKLRTKLILISSVITSAVAMVSGTYAVLANEVTAVTNIDRVLDSAALQIEIADDAIGAALLQIDKLGDSTEVAFYSINEELSVLGDTSSIVENDLTLRLLADASKKSITVNPQAGQPYRLRSVKLPDNEFVLLATSLKEVKNSTYSNIFTLASFTALAVLLGALLLWIFTRRDLGRVESLISKAERIASGEINVGIAAVPQKSELDILNNSLAKMIGSLNDALDKERGLKLKMNDFLADASHELRTPLAIIRGYFELLFAQPRQTVSQLEQSRERIHEQIMRMQSLIDELLLLTEMGQLDSVSIDRVDLSRILRDSVSDLRVLHPKQEIAASIQDEVYVSGTKRLLEQLLANLISNLSRYVPEQAQVKISLSQRSGVVSLQVDDAGPGIPESAYSEQVRAFKRFDDSRSRDLGGAGLGMSIMAAIVEKHGGTIRLSRSDLGGLRTNIEFKSAV